MPWACLKVQFIFETIDISCRFEGSNCTTGFSWGNNKTKKTYPWGPDSKIRLGINVALTQNCSAAKRRGYYLLVCDWGGLAWGYEKKTRKTLLSIILFIAGQTMLERKKSSQEKHKNAAPFFVIPCLTFVYNQRAHVFQILGFCVWFCFCNLLSAKSFCVSCNHILAIQDVLFDGGLAWKNLEHFLCFPWKTTLVLK